MIIEAESQPKAMSDNGAPRRSPRKSSRAYVIDSPQTLVVISLLSEGGLALTIIEEFLLFIGDSWLRKVLKKSIIQIYKQDLFVRTLRMTSSLVMTYSQ